ncbi:MAG: DUF393 domain-containing protein [Cellulomonas sp.]|nr:DUF393 domain-containing protein [Cellulomonas sp.]
MPRSQLLYDADCGFCTRAVGWAPRLRLDLEVRALGTVDLAALGVDPQRAQRELPHVTSDGTVTYGHRAVASALLTGPVPARMAGRLLASRALDRPAAAGYRWVAAHRHRLPGGRATCVLPAADGEGRGTSRWPEVTARPPSVEDDA